MGWTDRYTNWRQEWLGEWIRRTKQSLTEISDKASTAAIRPVINLHKNVLYCSGDGTQSNPYIIGNGSCLWES